MKQLLVLIVTLVFIQLVSFPTICMAEDTVYHPVPLSKHKKNL